MPAAKINSQQRRAYERLRGLLILQQISPGQRLREAEWSRRLGVHRTSLREAFARLEADGLIEAGPSTGYFVPRLSDIDVREVNEIRVVLESLAIDRICRLGLNARRHLEAVSQAREHFEECIRKGYLLGSAEADRRFHEAIVDAAASRRLAVLYRRAPLPLVHQQMADPTVWFANERRTADEHRAILQAIRDGKAAKAQRLLYHHLLTQPLAQYVDAELRGKPGAGPRGE